MLFDLDSMGSEPALPVSTLVQEEVAIPNRDGEPPPPTHPSTIGLEAEELVLVHPGATSTGTIQEVAGDTPNASLGASEPADALPAEAIHLSTSDPQLDGERSRVGISVYTIGYGRRSMDAFIDALQRHGVTHLFDIRTSPYSRNRPEFDRERLRDSCGRASIRYVFKGRSLGGRPSDPECYDEEGHVVYERVLTTEFFQQGIEDLVKATADKRHVICLMCSESRPSDCHRSKLVGEALWSRGYDLCHITEADEVADQPSVMKRVLGEQGSLFDDPIRSRKPYRSRSWAD